MESLGPITIIIILVILGAYLVAPLKLFSIHSELQKIRKLLEEETSRARRERNLANLSG